jgi:hypothetical protein
MPTRRSVAVRSAQTLGGLLGVGAIAVVVAAAVFLNWPSVVVNPASVLVTPQPSEQMRVCPGPLLTLAEDSSAAESVTSVGASTTVAAATDLTSGASSLQPEMSDLAAPDNTLGTQDGGPRLLRVPVAADSRVAPLVAGSQSQTVATETLAGFAAASCAEAASDVWLVGGSTDIGRSTLVLLSNPTTVVATVGLRVYGETGLVDAPGSTGILVQPGTQRVVSLAGLAPNLKSPIVHVQSQGGQVVASLEQSLISGIVPEGVDLIGATRSPSLEQTLPGVTVTSAAVVNPTAEATELQEGAASVRMLVTGDKPATVQIGAISEGGANSGTSIQVQIPAGIATEVPLAGLAPGGYAVTITSDRPVVAAATASTSDAGGKDFAWFTSAEPMDGDFLVTAAPGPAPTLHLFNAAATDATLTLRSESGAASPINLKAGAAVSVPVAESGTYLVNGSTAIVAGVGYVGPGKLASFTIRPAGPLASPIAVYLR